jgi:hypothetical protein
MSSAVAYKPLMSVRETADLLGWKLSRMYEATRRREIPGLVEINGRLLYRRRVVEAWLDGDSIKGDPL